MGTTGTDERSKPLHNFTMPGELRWGHQRFLRCMKVNPHNAHISTLSRNNTSMSNHHRHHRRHQRDNDSVTSSDDGSHKVPSDDGGIAATREKLILDLQAAADTIKDAIFSNSKDVKDKDCSSPEMMMPSGSTCRPWNLRTRRAACNTPTLTAAPTGGGGGGDGRVALPRYNPPEKSSATAAADKSARLRSGGAMEKATELVKLSVALSKREIAEDFLAITGQRPHHRPKKRARIVQRQLDTLFPGLWLTEVTADMYKVADAAA